jgi:hypothetical protein
MIIYNDETREEIVEEIRALDLEKKWVIEVKPWKRNRSLAQNSLYHLWLNVIYKHTGELEDDLHKDLAYKFLDSKVEERDGKTVVWVRSTTTLNVKEFTEYLNKIEQWAHFLTVDDENPFTLPHPEDIYYDALNRRGYDSQRSGN